MTTSSTKGGGFLIGAFYGAIASTALYLVLSYIFPINPIIAPMADSGSAPVVMETAGAGAMAPESGSGPVAPDMTAPEMATPDSGENDNNSLGGAGDTSPASVANTQIAGTAAVSEPAVATEPAAVPDIGNGTDETQAPGAGSPAPAPVAEVATNAPTSDAPSGLAQTASGPALEVFAAAFSGDTSKPMLAIVLEDTLETSLQPLVESGQPFSFALPAGIESSASARAIRESGFEVVAMIPREITNTEDLAANIDRFMQNVPVAVALLDTDVAALMLKRTSMQVFLDTATPRGLGLISYSRNGELIARAQAESAGAIFGSALLITDDFDDEELIIQALNQAAFVAGTNDRAIIFAKTNQATINGILRWLDSPRAAQLVLVPVSVALQRPSN